MWIDFGSYESGNQAREKEIAESIRDTVQKNPLTVVLTHQHKDHLSGFISAKAIMVDSISRKSGSLTWTIQRALKPRPCGTRLKNSGRKIQKTRKRQN